MKKWKKKVRYMCSLIMAVALMTGLLAGCSGGSSSDASASADTEAADTAGAEETSGEEEESGELTTVTMVSPTALASMDLCWVYVAQEMGYFEEEGLIVEMIECTDATDPKILASGTAQFAGFSPSIGLAAVDAGVDNIVSVCNVVSSNMFGIAYNLESGISDWSDLEGCTIATLSDASNVVYDPILTAAGVDVSTITYVAYGSAEYEALDTNQASAMGTWLSEYYMCEGMGYEWGYLSGNDVLPQIANSVWTTTEFAEENPEIVEGFVRAVEKACYFMYLNPEATADIVLNMYPSIEITWEGAVGAVEGNVASIMGMTQEEQVALVESKEIGLFDMDVVAQTIQNLYDGGAISEVLDASVYYTNEYVTTDWDYEAVEADAAAYECTSDIYLEQE